MVNMVNVTSKQLTIVALWLLFCSWNAEGVSIYSVASDNQRYTLITLNNNEGQVIIRRSGRPDYLIKDDGTIRTLSKEESDQWNAKRDEMSLEMRQNAEKTRKEAMRFAEEQIRRSREMESDIQKRMFDLQERFNKYPF